MDQRYETWDSFWAKTLRIDFFENQWEMYHKVADARAEWLEKTFQLDKTQPVLSCACGEAGIELALARRGFNVTGIDRCPDFIHFAREQAARDGSSATFLVSDIAEERDLGSGYGTVMCFDTLGLLSSEAEEALVGRMARSLHRDGILLIDGPQPTGQVGSRVWWPVRDGHLLLETRWDRQSSTQLVEPLFIGPDGTRIGLKDPYDSTRNEHTGVQRYVYEPKEMAQLIAKAGLPVKVVKHQRAGYFMVAGCRDFQEENQ